MSAFEFDFSDVKLIKMPSEKPCAKKKFKKPKFQKPAPVNKPVVQSKIKTPEVVTLSDSEDYKDAVQIIEEPVDVINIEGSSSSEDECENPSVESVEVITLDDSDSFCNSQPKSGKVSQALDYIPIPDYLSKNLTVNQKKRKKKQLSPDKATKKRKKKQELSTEDVIVNTSQKIIPLMSLSLTKKRFVNGGKKIKPNIGGTPILKLAQSNIHVGCNKKTTGLRPVVIDGSNVGFSLGKQGRFDIKRVILVIQYFIKRGHTDITCFLPAHFRNRAETPEDCQIIDAYEKDGIISYTPSRNLFGKKICPYDDRFIVQYASEFGGVIISNDGYRDICEEEPSWLETVQNRLINYTLVKDTFMLPKDPLGRNGPSLDEVLKFS